MSEQEKNLYNFDQAQKEAKTIEKKAEEIVDGENVEKEDYDEAEREIDLLKAEKQKELEKALSNGEAFYYVENIINSAKEKNIELNLTRPEVAQACQKGLGETWLRRHPNLRDATVYIDFAKKNGIELNIYQAFQKGLEEGLMRLFDDADIEIKTMINIAKENGIELNIHQAFQEALEMSLSGGMFYKVKKIINSAKENNIEIDLTRPEVAQACQKGLDKTWLGPYPILRSATLFINFAKKNGIELDIYQAFQKGLENALMDRFDHLEISAMIDIAKENDIELNISQAFQKGLEMALSNEDYNRARLIISFAKKKSIGFDLNRPAINYPQGTIIKDILETIEIPQIGRDLESSLRKLTNFSFPTQIKPIINAQGEAAFLYFESIKRIENYQNLSAEDTDYITHIAKKYGTQARNILDNILTKVDSIGEEREMIEEFIQDIGIIHFDIYQQCKQAKEENDQEKITELKEGIKELHNKIYQGEMEEKDFDNELYSAVSYHTFPPAIGITQDQYERLNKERPDRKDDVPESLDELQYEKFEVSTGKYNLGEDEELNLEKWTSLGNAIKKVNAELEESEEVKINEEEIADNLIKIYKEKNAEKQENQDYLFESMYRYHLAQGGGKMESGFEISIQGLMQYKEFIGDRIKNDLIKDCLSKWQVTHQKEFAELQKDTLNRIKTSQARNFAKVKNMLKAINKQKDEAKKEKTIQNLDEFLKHFGLSYESVKTKSAKELEQELETVVVEYEGELTEENYQTEEYYNSPAFLKAYDEFLAKHDNEALVYQKISSDLIAGINKKMRKEVDKFQFEDEAGKTEKRELEFAISKKKEHCVAGYNMGVCVAPDEKLWNDEKFMNCIIFDPELKQAMGGAHFLIRENNLCLPGINPSLDVLDSVKNEELFDKMIAYAKKVKEKLGLDKILIPSDSVIYSNRTQIQDIIRNKNFKKHDLKQSAEFSYEPFEYSFQECYEVD